MTTFTVTYDHTVYKPSNYDVFKQQQLWKVEIIANDLQSAKETFKKEYNKNPSYFKFVSK